MKNTVTVSQEKILQETTERLQKEQRELQDTQQKLRIKEEEVTSCSYVQNKSNYLISDEYVIKYLFEIWAESRLWWL